MKHVLRFCLAALSIAVVTTTQATDAVRRPNVLFIAVDDLNTRIGCYGDPVARTPHLDRLARSGIRFERSYCQFPICNPSRASLLLGRYPTTTQIIDFSYPALLGRDWVTLPQHFRNNGYEVRLLGKVYHFDKDLMKSWFHEEVPGDEYPPDWTAGEKWVRKSQEVHANMLADLTRWEPYRSLSPPPSAWVKMLRTWANVFGPVPNAEEEGAAARARAYEWTADVKNAKQAIEQLTRWASLKKPFFLGVGFYKPHVPLVAPKRFFDLYPPEKMPLPVDFAPTPTADDSVPRCALRYNLDLFYEERPTPERARAATAAYYACISFMDEQLGLRARCVRTARSARQHGDCALGRPRLALGRERDVGQRNAVRRLGPGAADRRGPAAENGRPGLPADRGICGHLPHACRDLRPGLAAGSGGQESRSAVGQSEGCVG